MRNKIAAGIMLLAGSVAVIVCLLNRASLDTMLLAVVLTMFVFMIIGFFIQGIVEKMDKDAQERLEAEAEERKKEEARLQAEKEEADRLAREVEIEMQLQNQEKAASERENAVINDIIAAGESAKRNNTTF